jgi:glycosyltransferase involved in cell wall biosynthesis
VRVVYVITRADVVGGASVHVRDLAAGMRDRGHEPTVLIGGEGPVTEELDAAGIPYRSLRHLARSINPVRDVRAVAELVAALNALQPDLISVHTAKAGWIGRAAARRLHAPVLYTPHGWSIGNRISKAGGIVFAAAERLAARWADAIVCVSEYEKRLALRKRVAPAERLHVIYNGVRDIAPGLRARPGGEPVRIVSVARFEPPKDHRTLLLALNSIREEAWELELIGDGPREGEVQRLTAELGLADRVQFSGYSRTPASALANAQIFVLSSRSEGFPRSILEGMRAGLPVVASDVGGVAEAVTDGRTGRVVASNAVQPLAHALKFLVRNGLDRQRMGAEGRLTYESRFRFERMLEDTASLYATIVETRQHKIFDDPIAR